MKNSALCFFIITISYMTSVESLICDTCTCNNGIVNCTDSGVIDILDLWDHADTLKDAILLQFDYDNIVHVKQLPPSKVVYLSLKYNKINKIDELAFTHLKFMKQLDLRYNCLTTENLKPNIFKVPKRLKINLFRVY